MALRESKASLAYQSKARPSSIHNQACLIFFCTNYCMYVLYAYMLTGSLFCSFNPSLDLDKLEKVTTYSYKYIQLLGKYQVQTNLFMQPYKLLIRSRLEFCTVCMERLVLGHYNYNVTVPGNIIKINIAEMVRPIKI
jgi:hypothetical protein